MVCVDMARDKSRSWAFGKQCSWRNTASLSWGPGPRARVTRKRGNVRQAYLKGSLYSKWPVLFKKCPGAKGKETGRCSPFSCVSIIPRAQTRVPCTIKLLVPRTTPVLGKHVQSMCSGKSVEWIHFGHDLACWWAKHRAGKLSLGETWYPPEVPTGLPGRAATKTKEGGMVVGRWAGFLRLVPVTFPPARSQRSTASCGRNGKGVIPTQILNKEKKRAQDACPGSHSRRLTWWTPLKWCGRAKQAPLREDLTMTCTVGRVLSLICFGGHIQTYVCSHTHPHTHTDWFHRDCGCCISGENARCDVHIFTRHRCGGNKGSLNITGNGRQRYREEKE